MLFLPEEEIPARRDHEHEQGENRADNPEQGDCRHLIVDFEVLGRVFAGLENQLAILYFRALGNHAGGKTRGTRDGGIRGSP